MTEVGIPTKVIVNNRDDISRISKFALKWKSLLPLFCKDGKDMDLPINIA
jgi:hypothetical protein